LTGVMTSIVREAQFENYFPTRKGWSYR
jgi:hypothetical protein